ncbi:probable G-protein coupled receptor 141 [Betta splendens]|uniref:Probable G-protein coupled receptor 141 n=1 Tax=Betta splendens TaxID=158456 RepID=A0A6P7MHB7_BETSP|nr:probable G-protein coupled receptor 141 [Betta splendens]
MQRKTSFHSSTHSDGRRYFGLKMDSAHTTIAYTSEQATTDNRMNSNSKYNAVLTAIYCVVLLSGTVSLSLMTHIMKSSSTSITSIAVLNLIFTHFIFLFTVPFRIYYYVGGSWDLGEWWCSTVSAMIHIHMYMSFLFYVIILIMRLIVFYHKREKADAFHRVHALVFCTVVWLTVLVAVPCVTTFYYRKNNATSDNNTCFTFGKTIQDYQTINYIISIVIVVVTAVLTGLQANVLRVLYKTHHQGCTSQQDFGVQLKSLGFALIMTVCFIPYHMFRFYYIEHSNDSELENINEVFLTLTTFNCLDMLTFLGRRTCYSCFLREA